jgi:broad specificity polyphosphatase/5'/3'-nucleotidase SurE
MVVSGPNCEHSNSAFMHRTDLAELLDGRNSSTAFALSSGTIGAALASALAVPLPGPADGSPSLHTDHIPAIALSYGVIARPTPPPAVLLAHETAVGIVDRLWNDWGYESGPGSSRRKIQVYTVNVPLKEEYLEKNNRKVCWTTMWRNSYGQLFKSTTA